MFTRKCIPNCKKLTDWKINCHFVDDKDKHLCARSVMSCNKTLLRSSTDGHCFVANTPVCSEDVNKVLKLILRRNILLESLI